MVLPAAFGCSWNDFLSEWCAGSSPPWLVREIVEEALTTLQRLWPEQVAKITSPLRPGIGVARGTSVVAEAVAQGIVLSTCQSLAGFDKVLGRMKQDLERSRYPYSELILAATLVRLGYRPDLEPAIGAKALDARISTDCGDVYFEVIAPSTSDAMLTTWDDLGRFANDLPSQNDGRRIDVLLRNDLSPDLAMRIGRAVEESGQSEKPFELATDAVIFVRDFNQEPISLAHLGDPDTPLLLSSCARSNAAASVAIAQADDRAKRLLYKESKHFSRNEMNVLAVNLWSVPGAMKSWPKLFERCFQPLQNRRIGAVVLFTAWPGTLEAFQWQCQCVRNPHAERPVAQSILDALVTAPSLAPPT